MTFFSAIGGALNSIPVVGHVKGVIHYATGDTEAGTRAMHSATRTAAVIGGGVAGAVAGPGGAIAGAIGAGAAVDTVITGYDSIANDEYRPHGQLEAWTNVFTGNDVMANLADAAITTTLDGLGGYGASGLGKAIAKDTGKAAIRSATKETTKQVLKQEVKKAVLKGAVATNAYKELKKESRRRRRWRPAAEYEIYHNSSGYDAPPVKRNRAPSKDQDSTHQGSDTSDNDRQSTNDKNECNDEQYEDSSENDRNGSSDAASGGNQYPSDNNDDDSESESETDVDDISSTDDESESDGSDDESSCQAVKVNGEQCKKRATENGACVRWKHQTQMKRFKGRLQPLPAFRPFQIKSLQSIKENNSENIQKLIDLALRTGPYGEPGYIYQFQMEGPNGIVTKIGCTQRHPDRRMNEQFKDEVKLNPTYWRCPSYQLAEYLIHKFLSFARLRDEGTNYLVELFDVSESLAKFVCREVIEALKKNMKKKEDASDDDDATDEDDE